MVLVIVVSGSCGSLFMVLVTVVSGSCCSLFMLLRVVVDSLAWFLTEVARVFEFMSVGVR